MTNSLRKDSHMTLGFTIPKNAVPYYNSTGARIRKQYNSAPECDSVRISVNKPAEINFCGLSSRTLANDVEFEKLVNAAKDIVGSGKKEFKRVMQLMRDSADYLLPQAQKRGKTPKVPSETVKKFVDENKSSLQKMVDRAQELTLKDTECKINDLVEVTDPNNPSKHLLKEILNPEKLRNETIDSIKYATEAVPVVGKDHWYAKNSHLNKFLALANGNNVAFGATFALILTGIFRPASIMALPGDKKNNDDKKYAAAHSIASGVIGYIVATVVSKPISDAMNEVLNNPQEYVKEKGGHLDFNKAITYNGLKSNAAANTWISRGVDILMAIPKACITIALIPPILKYIFGWEKKKHADKPINIQTNYNHNQIEEKRPQNIAGGIK